MRTLQGLAQKDMNKGGDVVNDWYNGFVSVYGKYTDVWDKPIMDCFDGAGVCANRNDAFKKYVINKGLIGIVTGYVAYEIGSGLGKAKDGLLTDTGAPYAMDEAAAFYVGNKPCSSTGAGASAVCSLYSPYEFNWKRDLDYADGVDTHTRGVDIINSLLLDVRGTYNKDHAKKAETAMYKIFAIAAIRSAIKYSKKASDDIKYLAEGEAYWKSAAGWIGSLSSTAKTTVGEINALFDMSLTTVPASTFCAVKEKVESLYAEIGIDCGMVGTWKDDPKTCPSKCSPPATGGTLLAGSAAYVDMCKAPSDGDDGGASGARHSAIANAACTAAAVSASYALAF